MAHRVQRVNEQLKREITDLLRTEVRDPRVAGVMVTAVTASKDLTYARIHVTSLTDTGARETMLAGLGAAAPFVRRQLSQRLSLRRVPELDFRWDETLENARRIEGLIEQVRSDAEPMPDGDSGEEGGADSEPEPDAG